MSGTRVRGRGWRWAVAWCLGLSCISVWAFELGALRLEPRAGQDPAGTIALKGVADVGSVMAWVASKEGYAAAGLNPAHARPELAVTPYRGAAGDVELRLPVVPLASQGWDLLIFVTDPARVEVGRYRIEPRAKGDVAVQSLTRPFVARAARAGSSPAAASSVAGHPRSDRVRVAVEAWAQAWSQRDVAAYLDSYAPDYAGRLPGQTRDQWVLERTARLQAHRRIEVGLSGLAIADRGDAADALFTQSYLADGKASRSRKQLTLKPFADGRWRITREVELP